LPPGEGPRYHRRRHGVAGAIGRNRAYARRVCRHEASACKRGTEARQRRSEERTSKERAREARQAEPAAIRRATNRRGNSARSDFRWGGCPGGLSLAGKCLMSSAMWRCGASNLLRESYSRRPHSKKLRKPGEENCRRKIGKSRKFSFSTACRDSQSAGISVLITRRVGRQKLTQWRSFWITYCI